MERICNKYNMALEIHWQSDWTCSLLDPDDGHSYIVTTQMEEHATLSSALLSLRAMWETYHARQKAQR